LQRFNRITLSIVVTAQKKCLPRANCPVSDLLAGTADAIRKVTLPQL